MAMSDDIRSVRSFLGSLSSETFNPALVDLACSNLEALAEQVEALENTPLALGQNGRRRQARPSASQMEMLSLLQ